MKNSSTKQFSPWLFIFTLFLMGINATAQSPNALHFDGANDYVAIGDADALDMTENYTLECWIRLDGFASMAGIISKYHSGNSNGYFLRMANFPDNSIEFDGMTTVPLINQGQWYHIAAVKNGNNRYLYLNGLSKTLSGTPIAVEANTDPLTIGVDYLEGPRHFNGAIDEVRIWNVARTQEEIQQAMKTTIDPSEPGLVAYYKMNQGIAGGNNAGLTQVIDATAAAHHGTAMNFAMNGNTSNWITGSIPVNKLYVDVSATGVDTGSSWENAYTSLSVAMDFARSHTEIDSILVAKGIYYPETIAGDGATNRDKAFVLVPDVKLYGGFQPGGTGGWEARELPDADNPWNGTVLSGDFNGDDEVTGSGATLSIAGNTENAYHVVIAAGDVGNALMDGFIITGGYADGPSLGGVITVNGLSIKKAWGGGIYIRGASPVFTNMLVWGNSTRTDVSGRGGGIYTEQQAAPLFTFSNIRRNLGGSGGGIFNESSSVFSDVVTDGNKAVSGGGMYNSGAVVDLTRVTLNGNDALNGGGMFGTNVSSVTIKESVVSNNTATDSGGGIYNSASLSCTGTVFIGNTANYNGGAVYSTVYTQLTNTLLAQNTAVAGDGGAIYNNGAILGLVLANVTITGNTAAGGGGGIRNLNTGGNPITPQIDNSIIWGNHNASGIANVSNDLSIPKYSYCLIQGSGGSGGWVEEFGQDNGGNIDTNPLFVNSDNPAGNDGIWGTADDGLALSFCSPSVNAGSNADIPEGTTTDITGNPRIYDGTVDMGAYELQSSAHPATVYVDATAGNDNNQGNSWNASFKTLSYALEVVKNSACYTGVDTILVAKGTYFPQQKAGNGTLDRDKSFVLLPNVKIYGGFQSGGAGGWDAREMPDPENLLAGSILNGDFSQNDDVTGSGGTLNITGNGENAYHVVISAGNVGTALLDGFSIKSGNADSEDEEPTGNIQVNGQQVPRHSGGGIINVGSSPAYNNIFIWGNDAYDYGGGIYSQNSSSVITNSFIGWNMVYFAGAGMMNMDNSPVAVSGVKIWGNRVTGSSGGGVNNVQSSATFTNVVIEGNSAYYSGGGMHNGNSSPVLTNVLIADNTALYSNGGGINNYQSSPLLYNVTIVNNRCGDGYAGGGMFNTESSNPQLFNSIIWGNTNTNGAASGIVSWWSSIPVFSNNLIQDSGGSGSNWIEGFGTDNGGNIDADPLFVNPDNPAGDDGIWGTVDDGLFLQPESPAINSGDLQTNTSGYPVQTGETDITGGLRILESIIDMGAYESLSADAVIWTIDDEWRNGVEPEESKDVFIQGNLSVGTDYEGFSAKTLTVQNGGKLIIESGNDISVTGKISNGASAGDFIVQSGTNLLQSDDVENAGQVTVRRDSRPMKRLDYTLWSSPVTGQNLFNFSPETVNGVTNYPGSTGRIYIYDGASGYVNPNPFDENSIMNPGTGYLFRSPNNFSSTVPAIYEGVFTGIPFNGSLSISTHADEFTSIGNPYPSNLDADLFLAANPEVSTLYFWVNTPIENGEYVGNNYATYTITGGTSNTGSTAPGGENVPSGIIAAGQGFIVYTTGSNVNFDNTMRTDETTDFFKPSEFERHRFWLNLSDGNHNGLNQILIGYITGATNGVDNQIDGKLFGYEGSAIYSLIDDASIGSATKLTIQGRSLPFEDSDVVPLGFKAVESGKFKIELADFDGLFAEGQKIYLKDKELDVIQDLEIPYEFESEAGTFDNRFEIIYKNDETMGIDDLTVNGILIYKNQNFIEVSSELSLIDSVEIFDLSGRKLFSESEIHSSKFQIDSKQLGTQILVVKVKTQNGVLTNKKLIN